MFPKLFTIGSFSLPTYGLLVALGFLAGLSVTLRLAKRADLPTEQITNLAIYCALAGIAGAKSSCSCSTGDSTCRIPRVLFLGHPPGRGRVPWWADRRIDCCAFFT